MDSGRKALLICDSLQQIDESRSLLPRERGAKGVIMLKRDGRDLREGFAAFAGELKRVGAAVVCTGLAGDQAKRFHFIDDSDQPAGVHAELGGELALADSG